MGLNSGIRQQGHKRIEQPGDYNRMLKGIQVNMYFFIVSLLSKSLTTWSVAWQNRYIRYMRLYPTSQTNQDLLPLSAEHTPTLLGIPMSFFRKRLCVISPSKRQASSQPPERSELRPAFSESRVLTKPHLTHTNPSRTQLARHSWRIFCSKKRQGWMWCCFQKQGLGVFSMDVAK